MLNHTSGLRDWGSVAAIAGWPRTTRVHTHAHVLDIVSRQRALNFPSGTRYSYSNTGYNLAAIIVSRVSGQPFAEFTRARIFVPLGMTRTSWRDDYTRIVKDRAIAYAAESGGFSTDMPFENVHGNGGLLTTVGDLLRWTAQFLAADRRRRGVREGRAGARTIQRRPPAQLRARAGRRDVPGRARGVAQRRDGRLSRVALATTPSVRWRWPSCATSAAATRRSTRTPSRTCISVKQKPTATAPAARRRSWPSAGRVDAGGADRDVSAHRHRRAPQRVARGQRAAGREWSALDRAISHAFHSRQRP